ncbi:unnamed protein product [Mucor fragilis]
MSFTNLTSNETYDLKVGEPTYIGRHKYGIESKFISERQLKVILEEDNRCFITNLSNKRIRLNQAAILINDEHQLQDGDEIDLLLEGIRKGRHLKFKFNLPQLDEELVRNVAMLKKQREAHVDDGNNSSDYSQSSNENELSSDEQDDVINYSDISQESSLLGEKDYLAD